MKKVGLCRHPTLASQPWDPTREAELLDFSSFLTLQFHN